MSSSADPFDLIRHEETDILISYGPALSHPKLISHSLGLEEMAPLCSPAIAARYLTADGLRAICHSLNPRSAVCAGENGSPSTNWQVPMAGPVRLSTEEHS